MQRRALPLLRWYLVAPLVGTVIGAVPLTVGLAFTAVGNALEVCDGEMGCAIAFVAGWCVTPLGFICGGAAAGFTANRMLRQGEVSRPKVWKASFGAGFLALLPAGLLTLVALGLFQKLL